MKFGQVAVLGKKASADVIVNTLLKQNADLEGNVSESDWQHAVRTPLHKIDTLIQLLSNLQAYNDDLEQQLSLECSPCAFLMPKIQQTLIDIQKLSRSFKVVPIKTIFHKLSRVCRETASEMGKKINLTFEGEYVEIDKLAAEKLADPLAHLLRNAIAHGIEDEETRINLGKKIEGRIKISASSQGGYVSIKVSDDGSGIDTNAIYQKALELKLLEPYQTYSEEEILSLIFQPGFTTKDVVTSVSGRGVGMNIVETELNKLKAQIQIKNSFGKGCEFVITIPEYNNLGNEERNKGVPV